MLVVKVSLRLFTTFTLKLIFAEIEFSGILALFNKVPLYVIEFSLSNSKKFVTILLFT